MEHCELAVNVPDLHSDEYSTDNEQLANEERRWMYHIIDSIKSFGAINGFTTETYESLHKEYVKIPYRLSNKKDIEVQLIKIVCI